MKFRIGFVLLVILSFCVPVQPCRGGRVIRVNGATDDLADVISRAPDSSVIVVEGHHWLKRKAYVDSTCGNCENPRTIVSATVGLVVKGTAKRIVGISPDSSVIHTGAGYGVLFEHCAGCAIESLSITGGARDADGNASDAAVVVKESSVLISHNRIFENIGDSSAVQRVTVGVMGITGREGSEMRIVRNEIVRNSWDGIALYRDARAVIEENLIDGVDLARGQAVGGGRGVGIGLTWNARADVRANVVRKYWKGIGIFVDANASISRNVVEDVATWGISLWDADKGRAQAEISDNVVFRSGACGAAIISGGESGERSAGRDGRDSLNAGGPDGTRGSGDVHEGKPGVEKSGQVQIQVRVRSKDEVEAQPQVEPQQPVARTSFTGNVLVMTGQNPKYDSGEPYCFQQALALHKTPLSFKEARNIFFLNREPENRSGARDVEKNAFLAALAELERELRASPATAHSEFLKWLDAERRK